MLGLSPVWNAALRAGADPVVQAGGIYLLDDRSRYVRPGLAFARAQQVYGVQGDGSLTAYTGSQVPWETQGVRLDPGWTQYASSPTDATNVAWTKTRCTPSTVAAANPFGGTTMSLLKEDTSVSLSHWFQSSAITSVTGQAYSITAILYPNGRNFAAVTFTGGGGADRGVFVNLLTGAITGAFASYPASYSSRLRSDGGVEVFISETAPGAAGYAARVFICNAENSSIYTGDGNSGIRIAILNHTNTGYQVPFVTSAVTVPNFSFSGLLADMGITLGSEYSLGVEYISAVAATDKVVCGMSSGAFANSIYFIPRNASAQQSCSMISGNAAQLESMSTASAAVGAKQRVLLRAKLNDSRAGFNSVLSPLDSACSMPIGLTNVTVGKAPWGGNANDFAGWVSKLWLVPSLGLSDSQLQGLGAIT